MTQFVIGDRVEINAKGFRKYGKFIGIKGGFGNPECEGIVTCTSGYIKVDWEDGTHNSYIADTLDLIITSLENK
ncbi:hypothetical protein [Citrobacter phage CVT22]|uniref:Uncharacterized protein n=1 Tax=Citrobacter phage CVT22 TaxID=1622234 RepID=A0A0R5ZWS0_9CAUD|nr:hypothetical protein APL39_gp66 [Citrobacter phage CVT22]AJT60770.1 hypothetical protein [Citrobacter phage CVT22]